MGRIVAPYGVKGWVKVQPLTEAVDGLLSYTRWWLALDGEWREHVLRQGRSQGDMLVAQLEGCDDRDQAFALRGLAVAVPRSALPPAAPGEFYWCDLIGLGVENTQGQVLGRVEDVFATGANDVLVVRGDRERLLPIIESVVLDVDLDGAKIRVDWELDY